MVRYGYACINMYISEQGFSVNRTMRKATFEKEGLRGAGEKALDNIRALIKTLSWNKNRGIEVYRMSSSMFPWMSHYEISQLPQIDQIRKLLFGAGIIAKDSNQRISFHPGQFTIIASPNPNVVTKSIKELNQHAEIMDMMGLDQSHHYPINIHLGGTYDSKVESMKRFCSAFERLSDSAKARLVVENDDKSSMYSVKDLHEGVYQKVGVPITFDYHHHGFCAGGLSEQEALELALSTWDTRPLTHYSSSKRLNEDAAVKPQAHADYVYEEINEYGHDFDCEIEAKAKEKAVLKYLADYKS